MKTDSFTKTVLSVIAVCLCLIVVKQYDLIPSVQASEPENAVTHANYTLLPFNNNTLDVRIVDISTYDELNVNLKSVDTYDEVKVNINSIDTSDELDVNIDEVGGSWVNTGSPIPVSIKQ